MFSVGRCQTMRVLLDECLPHVFRSCLPGHDVRTAQFMGWAGKKNGELLALMQQAGIVALVTVDRGIRHQQNLAAAGVSVVLMLAASNRLNDLVPLAPGVLQALGVIRPGDVIEVQVP